MRKFRYAGWPFHEGSKVKKSAYKRCIKYIFALLVRASVATCRARDASTRNGRHDRAMRMWSFKQYSPSPKGPKI